MSLKNRKIHHLKFLKAVKETKYSQSKINFKIKCWLLRGNKYKVFAFINHQGCNIILVTVLTLNYQSRVSLPWVAEHPDVFNDAAFTITATDSLEFSPRTSPQTGVPVMSWENRDEKHCVEGKNSYTNEA